MVNRATITSVRDNEISARTENFPVFDRNRQTRTKKAERQSVDDVILSLSDSYENRRARQVVEWVRSQSVRRTA